MPHFVITGTDTDIGKSVFSAGLTRLLDAHYWKPIQSGLEGETDSQLVVRLGVRDTRVVQEAYRLRTPCSPHEAAGIDKVSIDHDRLAPPGEFDRLIIEGAGGVLVPLTEKVLYADLFARWQIPVILVASTRLGTINHSLLSIEALRRRDIPIHGVAFVGDANDQTETVICEIGDVKRLGRLPFIEPLDAGALSQVFAASFRHEDFL